MYWNRRYTIRQKIRFTLAAAVVAAAVIVTGMVIQVAAGPHPRGTTSAPRMPGLFTSQPAAPSAAMPALAGPLDVIQGRQLINGVYLGYPHSTQGAVSAADEFMSDLGSTLDPDRAAAVMRLIEDPSWPDAQQQAAAGAAEDRQHFGLSASGPLPPGVSAELVPAEYQVRDVTADQVTVLLLADCVITFPGQGTQSGTGVYPLRMHWADSDWKVLAPPAGSFTALAAEPGSPQAAAGGWQELVP